ncbi:MAG: phosphoglucosamine mutase [Chitinivibrionales bacterium]|nr:phosphoglucosamine mutase [Chitinivibrionales bacterium]MBD3394827.1 phosphoglucosamine mutase [Chitinivibrionales bacterium]
MREVFSLLKILTPRPSGQIQKAAPMDNQPIMSVSGIRGKVGESLSPSLYSAMAFLQTKTAGGGRMLVGRDTRPTGPDLARAAFRGIRLAGGIPVDIGIAPTPTTCFAVKHLGASGGIVITASHNPLPYNGYKMVHGSGRLYAGDECDALYRQYAAGDFPRQSDFDSSDDTPAETLNAADAHVAAIVGAVDSEAIRNAGIRIAIDSVNGAGGAVFPRLLDKLGVAWEGVHTDLGGNFAHNPEPRPEHLADLAALLTSGSGFWGGFAFDPDADRLAPMGENGEPISEEMTFALALGSVLARNATSVATNLSTSMVIDDIVRAFGVKLFRTKIGEANVVQAMREHDCGIGGEGNGGVIYPRVSTVRDGPVALALILERMAKEKKKLTALAGEWNQYPIVKKKIPLGDTNAADTIARLAETFGGEQIDMQDGIKLIRDYGWVHVRPSNTEPILRCYAEAKTPAQAGELADMMMDLV